MPSRTRNNIWSRIGQEVQYWLCLYSVFNICTLEREKNNIHFFYHNIQIIEKFPRHNVNNNKIYKKATKKEVKKL